MITTEKRLLTLVGVVALLVGALIFADQKKGDYQPDQPSALSEVEGWKTYRNEEYGFEFQHPQGSIDADSYNDLSIQNFTIADTHHTLKPGEYSLEMDLLDSSCKSDVENARVVKLTQGTKYIGSPSPSLGVIYGGGYPLAMCAESGNTFVFMTVLEESENGTIAYQIFDSFKFTK